MQWPRLRGWLADDIAGRSVRRRLSVAAAAWYADGRDPTHLWRGTRLLSGLEFAQTHPEEVTGIERDFVDVGRQLADAATRDAEQRAAAVQRQNPRSRAAAGRESRSC